MASESDPEPSNLSPLRSACERMFNSDAGTTVDPMDLDDKQQTARSARSPDVASSKHSAPEQSNEPDPERPWLAELGFTKAQLEVLKDNEPAIDGWEEWITGLKYLQTQRYEDFVAKDMTESKLISEVRKGMRSSKFFLCVALTNRHNR
jgi:hypothetical protein